MEQSCNRCGLPTDGKYKNCAECRRKLREAEDRLRQSRRERGECIVCGGGDVQPPHTKCNSCLEEQRAKAKLKTQKNIADKKCIHCSTPAIDGHRLCEVCYLKQRATRHFKDVSRWQELKEVYNQQQGICPYTGERLVIGVNAELDHLVPREKGGSNEKSNLQWVLKQINVMKWHYYENEFLQIVKKVCEYRGL